MKMRKLRGNVNINGHYLHAVTAFRTAIALAAAFFLLSIAASLPSSAQGVMPHAIVGYVKDGSGNAMGGASVSLENGRTGESLSTATNSLGQYSADLSAMPDGYQVGDIILVSATSGGLEGDRQVTVTSSAFDMCNITVQEAKHDSLWTFMLPAIIVVAVVAAAIVAAILLRGKPDGPSAKKRRRGGR